MKVKDLLTLTLTFVLKVDFWTLLPPGALCLTNTCIFFGCLPVLSRAFYRDYFVQCLSINLCLSACHTFLLPHFAIKTYMEDIILCSLNSLDISYSNIETLNVTCKPVKVKSIQCMCTMAESQSMCIIRL